MNRIVITLTLLFSPGEVSAFVTPTTSLAATSAVQSVKHGKSGSALRMSFYQPPREQEQFGNGPPMNTPGGPPRVPSGEVYAYNNRDPRYQEPILEPSWLGISRDYQMRKPYSASDIADGLNVQSLAATFFLFFACLAPAVGFGGLFGAVTNGAIGTMEMVTSTAACGVLYAFFAAQPLTIIGSTGPVLAFVATLVKLADEMALPFLPLYAWTGIWTSLMLFVSATSSASNMVKYLTRFTDEIFSLLISAIFVVEAVSDIAGTFTNPSVRSVHSFSKALLSLALAVSTYSISMTLKGLRNTSYLSARVRNTISNFAPTIGVVSACFIARWARITQGAKAVLPALTLPATFGTTSGRPWMVPLFDLPVWARFAAFVPAMMAYVLLFLDQNITVRLVNNPQYKMIKGRRPNNVLDGMHLDMLVISLLTFGQSLIGFPWLVAATVRSVSHVRALTVFGPNGERVGTMEQRVTGIAIHALIGCCVLFAGPRNLLSRVPLSALMGLFLYLGVSSLPGNEMWERIQDMFKDKRISAERRWTRYVPVRITNLFTSIQCLCLAAMFYVKSSPWGVLFPVVIAMLAPLKVALEKSEVIRREYMEVLDLE